MGEDGWMEAIVCVEGGVPGRDVSLYIHILSLLPFDRHGK